jgi:lipoprotein-releasing system permease protein
VPGVLGVAPFSINPMMLTHGEATATGVLLKGVDPEASLGVDGPPGTVPVLDLPQHIIEGNLAGLRFPDAKPAGARIPGEPSTSSMRRMDELLDAGAPEPERRRRRANVKLREIKMLEADDPPP